MGIEILYSGIFLNFGAFLWFILGSLYMYLLHIIYYIAKEYRAERKIKLNITRELKRKIENSKLNEMRNTGEETCTSGEANINSMKGNSNNNYSSDNNYNSDSNNNMTEKLQRNNFTSIRDCVLSNDDTTTLIFQQTLKQRTPNSSKNFI